MIAETLQRILLTRRINRLIVFFVLGIIFSLFALFLSLETGVGFVALFIISIAILPLINQRISLAEMLEGKVRQEHKEGILLEEIHVRPKRWSISQFFYDFWPIFEVYLVYFVTVFGIFILVGAWLDFGTTQRVFELQYGIFNPQGSVSVTDLLVNNIGVLLLGFLISFIFEFGATFVVVRNAIFWGLTLGIFMGSNTGNILGLAIIMPHLLLEASSYFVSSIAGGILSKAVVEERFESERFYSIFTQAISLLLVSIGLVILGAVVETIAFNELFTRFI